MSKNIGPYIKIGFSYEKEIFCWQTKGSCLSYYSNKSLEGITQSLRMFQIDISRIRNEGTEHPYKSYPIKNQYMDKLEYLLSRPIILLGTTPELINEKKPTIFSFKKRIFLDFPVILEMEKTIELYEYRNLLKIFDYIGCKTQDVFCRGTDKVFSFPLPQQYILNIRNMFKKKNL